MQQLPDVFEPCVVRYESKESLIIITKQIATHAQVYQEATLKPNASKIRELEKNVHKMCTGGGVGFGTELLIQFSPPLTSSAIGKMMPQGGFEDF